MLTVHCGNDEAGNEDLNEDQEVARMLVERYKLLQATSDVSQRTVEALNQAVGVPDLTKVISPTSIVETSRSHFIPRRENGNPHQRCVKESVDVVELGDYHDFTNLVE